MSPSPIQLRIGPTVLLDEQGEVTLTHDPLTGVTPEDTGTAIQSVEHIGLNATGVAAGGSSWSIDGGFLNRGDAFSGGEDISMPEVWNSLPSRTIFVAFEDPQGGISQTIAAVEFGNVTLVPEPSAALCLGTAIGGLCCARRRRHHHHHHR